MATVDAREVKNEVAADALKAVGCDATKEAIYEAERYLGLSSLAPDATVIFPRMRPRSGRETKQCRLKDRFQKEFYWAFNNLLVDGQATSSSEFGFELVRSGSEPHEYMGR